LLHDFGAIGPKQVSETADTTTAAQQQHDDDDDDDGSVIVLGGRLRRILYSHVISPLTNECCA
jgi:hypothetical protein